jgi:putative DNA primase/helicase
VSYHRKPPPLPAHLVDKARGASIMATLQSLDLRLKRNGPHELTGACPRCGGVDRFNINTTKGAWFCRGCAAKGGDGISLLMHVRGLPFREAVEDLTGESAVERPAPTPIEAPAKPKKDEAARNAFIRRMVDKTLRGIVPIIGTPGEAYLRDVRKINTGAIVDVLSSTAAIGWDQDNFFREDGHRLDQRRLGCIVAVMTDPLTGAPTGGISRTYLHEGQKVGKAKGLGPAGIVRLTPDEDVLGGLHIGEGLETCLAAMSIGMRPTWSFGSKGAIGKFSVLSGIECLTIFAEPDAEAEAQECAARWHDAGREVLFARAVGAKDINDLVKGQRP